MRHDTIAILLAAFCVSPTAFAQPAAGSKPPATSATPPPSPAPAASAPNVDDAIPRTNDAMLTPVSQAPRSLTSWEEAVSLARNRSADYGTALDEVEKAEGQSRVALANALPNLNGSASATHQFLVSTVTTVSAAGTTTTTGGGNTLQASLSLSVPILNVETWYAVGTARANVRAQKLSVDDERRQIVLAIVNALIAEAAAERVAETNRVGLSDSLQRLSIVETKQELGSGNTLDLLRARTDVLNARSSIVKGDEALVETREALGLALGVAEPVGLGASLDIPTIEAGVDRACRGGSIDERPDVAAARARLEVANRGITDVDLKYLPTITASSTASVTAVDQGASPRGSWNIQAALNWAIWDGGARYGLHRVAKASSDEAKLTLESIGRTAKIDVDQSTRQINVADQSAQISSATRDADEELDKLTRISYQEGSGTGLDLITAATALRQAEINVIVDQFNTAKARIDAALSKSTCKL